MALIREDAKMSDLQSRLDAYYRARGIHPFSFRCASRNSCAAGCRNFTEARASLVGARYGDPVRVTVLSLDPGIGRSDPADRTLEAVAARESRDRIRSLPKGRHWYRTYETVAALLSRFGGGARPEDAIGRFAHVNAAKCTQNLPHKKQAPAHLFENCRPHLDGEIAILAPQIIVTQGRKAADVLVPWQQKSGSGWGVVTNGDLEAFWLRLVHPTARGGAYVRERRRWSRLFRLAHEWVAQRG